jgi:wyosine [tRNA(Phe)-imidazoG37] synthetase (radical SAM superfamily)
LVLPLESGIIYGPLYSRRLGLSLGINLLPVAYKACSFNCIYCHYGLTDVKLSIQEDDFPAPDKVLHASEKALRSTMRFDTLTFSGNGEPTLHPHFIDIVRRVRVLVDRLRPGVTLSLYSNASTAGRQEILEVLDYFDNPILKLDCGSQQTFEQVNRPLDAIHLTDIVANLQKVPNLILQSLLVRGPVSNSTSQAVRDWQTAVAYIQPVKVQLYSCDYPVPIDTVERVFPYVLKSIAHETEMCTGVSVEPYWVS